MKNNVFWKQIKINRKSIDMDAMSKIGEFHQFLKKQRVEAPEPMYVIEKDEEHPTVPDIWWNKWGDLMDPVRKEKLRIDQLCYEFNPVRLGQARCGMVRCG